MISILGFITNEIFFSSIPFNMVQLEIILLHDNILRNLKEGRKEGREGGREGGMEVETIIRAIKQRPQIGLRSDIPKCGGGSFP
jgi:hypothetical protein